MRRGNTGATTLNCARFYLAAWIAALMPDEATCQALRLPYVIDPIARPEWSTVARHWLADQGIIEGEVLLTQGPCANNPCGNDRM